MKFGPVKPEDALGGVTVHAIRQGSLVLKKGTIVGFAEVAALKQAGVKLGYRPTPWWPKLPGESVTLPVMNPPDWFWNDL